MQSLDIELYRQLMALKHDEESGKKLKSMELSFSVTVDVLGSKRNVDLVPNGADILVKSSADCLKYIHLLSDYKVCYQLHGVHVQVT